MTSRARVIASAAIFAWLPALAGPAVAETCLSPFVKRLDRQEKYLYLFCVDADARDNDSVAVIDVDRDSATFGTIAHALDLGSKGNEAHHWGYTDDRTRIWAGGLQSSRIWILDVATDPARPRVGKVIDDIPRSVGLAGPHTDYALPGSGRSWIRMIHVGIDGMKIDPFIRRRLESPPDRPRAWPRHAHQLARVELSVMIPPPLLLSLLLGAFPAASLADIGPAPPVKLIDAESRPFSLGSLRGKAVLVSFVYTTCGGTCPLTAARLDRVRRALREEGFWGRSIEFVSITLDPDRDTPEALSRYARVDRADPQTWHFLTGPRDRVARVLASWDVWTIVDASGRIDHPSRVFLVDPSGHRREIYNLESLTPEAVVQDVRAVLAGGSATR